MTLAFQAVSVFGDAPFEGNSAAVFLDAERIPDDAVHGVARSIGGTGAAFVLPPTLRGAIARVRTIAGDDEPSFLAHTVLGSLHALVTSGRIAPEAGRACEVEVGSGSVVAQLLGRDGDATTWALGLDATPPEKLVPDIKALMKGTRLVHDDFDLFMPIERAASFILVPVPTRESLRRVTPDDRALVTWVGAREVTQIAFFCVESRDPLRIAARVVCPGSPLGEDAVTGTLHKALAPYLVANRVLSGGDGPAEYHVVQGDRFGRIGSLRVRLVKEGLAARTIEVVGTCRTWIDAAPRRSTTSSTLRPPT